MKKSSIVLLLLSVAFFVACQDKEADKQTTTSSQAGINQAVEAIESTTPEEYRVNVNQIMAGYLRGEVIAKYDSSLAKQQCYEQKGLVGKAKDQLLDLTVPVEYQQLHLDLVAGLLSAEEAYLSLTVAKDNQTSDSAYAQTMDQQAQTQFSEAEEKLSEALAEASWLQS